MAELCVDDLGNDNVKLCSYHSLHNTVKSNIHSLEPHNVDYGVNSSKVRTVAKPAFLSDQYAVPDKGMFQTTSKHTQTPFTKVSLKKGYSILTVHNIYI